MRKSISTGLVIVFSCFGALAQKARVEPGFVKSEYEELLRVSTRQGDSLYNPLLPAPREFSRLYRSEPLALDNRWELWVNTDSVLAISLRGTTLKVESWVENFFAAMSPLQGTFYFGDSLSLNYNLGKDPRAGVHTGWLIGTVFLFEDIKPKLDSCLAMGYHELLIVGHSQGGAIAYLLSSVLKQLQLEDPKYAKLVFKTYASAAPKPGNLYYAYEFESYFQQGWFYNVVNSADWVPEGPFSIQTTDDYNVLNPFKIAESEISNLSFPDNLIMGYVYRDIDHPTQKANRKLKKYLGEYISREVPKYIPGFKTPDFMESSNYVRVGHTIVLYADEAYYQQFPNTEGEIWQHHKFEAYFYLLENLAY